LGRKLTLVLILNIVAFTVGAKVQAINIGHGISFIIHLQGSEGKKFNEIFFGSQPRQDVKIYRRFRPRNFGKPEYLEAAVCPVKFH